MLTGDYRAQTFGINDGAIAGMQRLVAVLKQPVYGAALDNHDPIHMLSALEAMGIVTPMNESVALNRENTQIYLAGVDDAHISVSTIWKKPPGISLWARFPFCFPIPRKSSGMPLMLILM